MNYIDVTTLIPQKEPYIMVEYITDISPDDVTTLYKIKENSPFVRDDKMQAAGLVENIAQSCAAHIGYYSPDGIRIGLVGAVPSLEIIKAPRVDDILETTVKFTARAFQMSMAEAKIRCAGTLMAKGTIKLSLT